MTVRLILILFAVALAAASCGRRGAPERPASAAQLPSAPVNPDDPGSPEAPDRRFVLDPLLE